MKKTLFPLFLLLLALCAVAQNAREEIKVNPYLGGDNYTAYQEPTKALSPTPEGYEVFYFSHYGRHGSRYLIGKDVYKNPVKVLQAAHDAGQLTEKGEDVLKKCITIRDDAQGRVDELTPLGAQQHRGIARRLSERFPEIFGKDNIIDAKSSTIIRCILSMANEMAELQGRNPNLNIKMDASDHDMYYILQEDKELKKQRAPRGSEAEKALNAFRKSKFDPTRVMNTLFKSEDYWKENVENPDDFIGTALWKIAQNQQSLELRKNFSLLDIFTNDELYNIWLSRNADWYVKYGPSMLNGGTQIYIQRNLIKKIIEETEATLPELLKDNNARLSVPSAHMRFGHEVVVMPTACFMNLNGAGTIYKNLDDLEKNKWYSYKIFPMASNIQIVFYRPTTPNAKEEDVLVKFLLNEEEANVPDLKAVKGPYYKWTDVKAYWENKLSKYKE